MLVLSPIPELFNQLSGLLTTLLAVAAAIIGVVAWSKRSIVRLWFKQGQLALSESAVTAAQKLVDESQQLTIANLKTTLDAVTVRLKLLEDTMADKETAHAADMALLHAQLSKELNKKDEIIRDSQNTDRRAGDQGRDAQCGVATGP
jgi:hypothetical protein